MSDIFGGDPWWLRKAGRRRKCLFGPWLYYTNYIWKARAWWELSVSLRSTTSPQAARKSFACRDGWIMAGSRANFRWSKDRDISFYRFPYRISLGDSIIRNKRKHPVTFSDQPTMYDNHQWLDGSLARRLLPKATHVILNRSAMFSIWP